MKHVAEVQSSVQSKLNIYNWISGYARLDN